MNRRQDSKSRSRIPLGGAGVPSNPHYTSLLGSGKIEVQWGEPATPRESGKDVRCDRS